MILSGRDEIMTEYQDRNQKKSQQGRQADSTGQNNGQGWDNGNGWNGGQSSQGWENGNGYGANGYDRNYGNGSGRRLTRSYSNRMVCGVCAGIAEYFNWDPTIVRLIWVGASLLFGAGFMGLIAYFIVAVIMPEK